MNNPVLREPSDSEPLPRTAVPEDRIRVSVESARPGLVAVRVTGEIDMVTTTVLSERLRPLLEARGTAVLLDLTGVGFLGSAGLSELVAAKERAAERDVTLLLVANSRVVLRPLEVTGLLSLFQTFPSEEAALDQV